MVSFILPAFNEELLIARTIHSIRDAARHLGEPHEIIVADDASTDRTAAIAESLGAVVIHVNHRQIAATRNAGARAARGERFIFVDADSVVTPGAVTNAVTAMLFGAAGGGCVVKFDGRIPLHARLFMPAMMVMYRLARLASGSFLFCTRDTFDKTGGFDESLYASEELWFSLAIHRCGRFVFLRDQVITSGRKLRTYTAREIYGMLLRLTLRGTRGVKTREGLDLWYGERRVDPG